MGERVAIVGSRRGADLGAVKGFVHALYVKQPDTLVVSGGADGVDKTAENLWLELGGHVWSYRPKQIDQDRYGVEFWDLGGSQPRVFVLTNEPTFANYASAAFFRDSLIAEKADRIVAFYRRFRSVGTQATVDFAVGAGKQVYEYEAAA